MTLVIIFGPPAVGKMAVGMELARLTGYKLFHNHMTVDTVMPLFPFESPSYTKLVQEFRERVFEEFAAHGQRGLIFTFVWVLDDERDRSFVEKSMRTFTRHGGDVCFVELAATQAERLRRNETPLRMTEKRPQRNSAGSREFLLEADTLYRMNTSGDFWYADRHLRIDNTRREPEEVARQVVEYFRLELA
jgi:AAA domain